jgi:hypothetical protein
MSPFLRIKFIRDAALYFNSAGLKLLMLVMLLGCSIFGTIAGLAAYAIGKSKSTVIIQENNTTVQNVVYEIVEVKDFVAELVGETPDSHYITSTILKYCVLYDVPLRVGLALAYAESSFTSNAISHIGAMHGRGLLQVSEIGLQDYNKSHISTYTTNDLFNTDINVKIGLWLYKHGFPGYVKYQMDYYQMYCLYNVGFGNYNDYYAFYMNAVSPSGSYYGALTNFKRRMEEVSAVLDIQETLYENATIAFQGENE